MAKDKSTEYACSECGSIFAKWQGRCTACGAWNSMVEQTPRARSDTPSKNRHANWAGDRSTVQKISNVQLDDAVRTPTGLSELDRVLGGGLVKGSVVLLGGDPGIGKSTILLQVLAKLSTQIPTMYITGEESGAQVGLRAQRLGVSQADVSLLAETEVERIIEEIQTHRPGAVVIDSIQTVFTSELSSAPGTVAQVRECGAHLVKLAKSMGVAIVLVGHVTKEGTLAGPRVLEHMVDTVLYFEGEQDSAFRMLRAFKNRFGASNQMGVFAMGEQGLEEVSNPSSMFLTAHADPVPGTSVLAASEGGRPFLVELQALTEDTNAGNPRRYASGFELARLQMLLAVLSRHADLASDAANVYLKVVGGVRLTEPASDLAAALAIASTIQGKPLPQGLVVFGEVGLAGELRPVGDAQSRLNEAAKLGFSQAIVAAANMPKKPIPGLKVHAVARLDAALALLRELR